MRNLLWKLCAQRPGGHCRSLFFGGMGMAACLFASTVLLAQGKPKVPTVSAGAGSCSAGFVVQDGNHKPIYNAKIDLTFRYGFWSLHKATLEAYTDSNGEARFEGLPRQQEKPFAFEVRYGDRQKTVTDSPLTTCKAHYTVVLP